MALTAKCHCGATELEVNDPPSSLTRCTCTFCSKRGALWAYYAPEQVKIVRDPPPQSPGVHRGAVKDVDGAIQVLPVEHAGVLLAWSCEAREEVLRHSSSAGGLEPRIALRV